jgi:acetyl-CoA acetyltransferase family protein
MTDIVIVDAVRTPLGRRGGWLREVHPVRLGAWVVQALMARTGLPPAELDHVLMGCVTQAGEQTYNLARNVVLDAGLPVEVAATTLDFQCGSSQQAVHLAAAMVASGQAEVVIAGGVEHMTRAPMGSSLNGQSPFTARMMADYALVSQGVAADEIAQAWGVGRAEVDAIGYDSHKKAASAAAAGAFTGEIVPVEGVGDDGAPFTVSHDQGVRPNVDLGKMATLASAFTPDGVTTAGNSSQISDGAAAVMVTTSAWAHKLGLKPRARIVSSVTVGSDPHLMLTGPIPATHKVLARAGLRIGDIDLFEVNEAFAAVIAMWGREFAPDMARVNVHGGAIALGHPLGASGARLMATLLNALERHDKRLGLQTMCCGGGMGTGTILERLG